MAAHSVFFRRAFFGSGLNFKESSGTVIIKETTKEAFSAMIDFVYEKKIDFARKTIEELFDILNIAKRYQVDDLTLAVTNHFNNFPFTLNDGTGVRVDGVRVNHNLVRSVAYAMEFEQFPDETKALFKSAAIFLKKKLTSVNEVLSFLCNKNSDHQDVAIRLLADVKELPCHNCRRTPCSHGMQRGIPHISYLQPGDVVETATSGLWRERYQGKACQVISVKRHPATVELQFLNPPSPADEDVPNPYTWTFESCALIFKCNCSITLE